MLGRDLIQKMFTADMSDLPNRETTIVRTAMAAFLANLTASLKIPLPVKVFDFDPEAKAPVYFYSGVIVGYPADIPEEAIEEAHRNLTMPSNRAILSRMLYGPGDVLSDGLPAIKRAPHCTKEGGYD